jgi:hypothetical protein
LQWFQHYQASAWLKSLCAQISENLAKRLLGGPVQNKFLPYNCWAEKALQVMQQ